MVAIMTVKAVPSYGAGGATAPPEKLASEYKKILFVHTPINGHVMYWLEQPMAANMKTKQSFHNSYGIVYVIHTFHLVLAGIWGGHQALWWHTGPHLTGLGEQYWRYITMALVLVQTRNVPNVAHTHTGGHIQTGLGSKFLYVMCIVTMVT